MKLYTSIGPNPHVVRMFLAEKGLALETVTVDLMAGENRQPGHLARNPMGQTPTLELDDGSHLAEITAICEYIEELRPDPVLIGSTPEERARTRMWTRRIDINIIEPLTNGFRFSEGLAMFKDRVTCIPEAAPALKGIAKDHLARLERHMAGRSYIAADGPTLADILLYCFLVFAAQVGQPLDPANSALSAWFERMGARPSAAA